ncbi:hypothetical protein H4219_000126 [Mycoemilia scoparia]|uniref:Protein SCAI n=1 Tax=Mycoemilia scoparia TaxID=417184 RepID=A0A9W8A4H9_9FUNG|nr:hypothetical protein H4219_000126 [Mycoemilia scoparia]
MGQNNDQQQPSLEGNPNRDCNQLAKEEHSDNDSQSGFSTSSIGTSSIANAAARADCAQGGNQPGDDNSAERNNLVKKIAPSPIPTSADSSIVSGNRSFAAIIAQSTQKQAEIDKIQSPPKTSDRQEKDTVEMDVSKADENSQVNEGSPKAQEGPKKDDPSAQGVKSATTQPPTPGTTTSVAAAAGVATTQASNQQIPSTTTVPTAVSKTNTSSTTPDNEKEEAIKDVVIHFEYLLEKSQQQFVGLRDLPPIGGRQWITYFQRTFEIYTKLWKFQQQNRAILERPDTYGLKRREIGEIASKIGQLYYHYYLRTSETNYLQEAYTFYGAIRDRGYLKDDPENRNPALYIKKMRYYARFIVVCLLLNKENMVQDLLDELQEIVKNYLSEFNPVDEKEWKLVLKEIMMFLQAERKPIPVDDEGNPYQIVHRLPLNCRTIKDTESSKIRLQEAIIIGSHKDQIKFSELTLDMYRMLHALEREPSVNKDASSKDKDRDKEDVDKEKPASTKRPNPHKYLLYQPTYGQMIVFLANVFKEVNEQGCALVYVSGDGYSETSTAGQSNQPGSAPHKPINSGYEFTGGVITAPQKPAEADNSGERVPLTNCIHPADFLPFTRKPLFVIIESKVSSNFRNFPMIFGQPLLFLLSPTEYPNDGDVSRAGGPYTLFLNSTLMAFCFVSKLHKLSHERWGELRERIQQIHKCVFNLIEEKIIGPKFKGIRRFLRDDFLAQFIVRHVVACGVFYLHNSYSNTNGGLPSSSPELPDDLCYNPVVLEKIHQLIQYMGVGDLYTPYQQPRPETPVDEEEEEANIVPPAETEKIEDQVEKEPTGSVEEQQFLPPPPPPPQQQPQQVTENIPIINAQEKEVGGVDVGAEQNVSNSRPDANDVEDKTNS